MITCSAAGHSAPSAAPETANRQAAGVARHGNAGAGRGRGQGRGRRVHNNDR